MRQDLLDGIHHRAHHYVRGIPIAGVPFASPVEPDRAQSDRSSARDVGNGRISNHPASFPIKSFVLRTALDGLVKDAPVRLLDTEFPRSTEGVHDRKQTQAIGLLSLMRHFTIGHDSDS